MKKYAKETGNITLLFIVENFLEEAYQAAVEAIQARHITDEKMQIDKEADLILLETRFGENIENLQSIFKAYPNYHGVIFPESNDLLQTLDILKITVIYPALNDMIAAVGHRKFLDNFPAPPPEIAEADTIGVALDRSLANISGGKATELGTGANKFLGRIMQAVLFIPMVLSTIFLRITGADALKPLDWLATALEGTWNKYSNLAELGYEVPATTEAKPAEQGEVYQTVGADDHAGDEEENPKEGVEMQNWKRQEPRSLQRGGSQFFSPVEDFMPGHAAAQQQSSETEVPRKGGNGG